MRGTAQRLKHMAMLGSPEKRRECGVRVRAVRLTIFCTAGNLIIDRAAMFNTLKSAGADRCNVQSRMLEHLCSLPNT